MNTQQNLSLVRKYIEEVYSKGNTKLLDELLSKNIELHDPFHKTTKKGIDQIREIEEMYSTAFPNKNITIDELWGNEDHVAAHWTVQATHKGQLQEFSPTNKSFKLSGISLFRLRDGKIQRIDQIWDKLALYEQLGLVSTRELAGGSRR